MESHFRVEILPRVVPFSAREATEAAVVLGQALQDLGAARAAGGVAEIERAEDAYRGAKAVHDSGVKPDGLLARIGDQEFPITDFAVQTTESGNPMLSLILAPDSLSIGEPPVSTSPATETVPKVSSWGDGSIPDPRESIPGWQPEGIGEQIANHAERVALRTWEPSGGQEKASAFKRLVRLGVEGGNVAVTA